MAYLIPTAIRIDRTPLSVFYESGEVTIRSTDNAMVSFDVSLIEPLCDMLNYVNNEIVRNARWNAEREATNVPVGTP